MSDHRQAPSRIWLYVTILNPFGLIPIIGALIAIAFPPLFDAVESIGRIFGIDMWVKMRSPGRTHAEFRQAFDVLFVVLIPLNLLFTTVTGFTLKAIAELQVHFDHKAGIKPNINLTKRIKVAAIRVAGSLLLFFVIMASWMTTYEPNSCKGCESGNVLFYLLVNWLGFQLISNLAVAQLSIAAGVLKNRFQGQ